MKLKQYPRQVGALTRRPCLLIFAAFTVTYVGSCSTEPDEGGACALSCEKRIMPASDSFQFEALTAGGTVNCAAGVNTLEATGPVTIRYRVVATELSSDKSGGSDTSGGTGTTDGAATPTSAMLLGTPNLEIPAMIPRSNIGFAPITSGSVAVSATNPDAAESVSGNPVTSVTPFTVAGVRTGRSSWCSDTCGIATVEVTPLCVDGATFSVVLSSGAAKVPTLTFTLKKTN